MSDENNKKPVPTINVENIEQLKTVIAAQARIAVYEATVRAILGSMDEFDDIEDFANAMVEALLENAGNDMKLLKEMM